MSDHDSHPHLERTGRHAYIGHNPRGAEVRIGVHDTPGAFSPGELLQVALAACSALAADHTLAGSLGEDFTSRVDVSATKSADRHRYESIQTILRADLSELSEEKAAALRERTHRAIDRLCTVGHTLDQPTRRSVELMDDPELA